jgi:hypothetical protein
MSAIIERLKNRNKETVAPVEAVSPRATAAPILPDNILAECKCSAYGITVAIEEIAPQRATAWLERNKKNRPIRQIHVKRISWLIVGGRWKLNGNSIKIDEDGNVLDGQHRLWACIEANMPIITIVVYNIKRDAFATVDTVQALRTATDVLKVTHDVSKRGKDISAALIWLSHLEADTIATYRRSGNRIENDVVETAYAKHPEIVDAVTRVSKLGKLANVAILAFVYYVLCQRNAALAARFINSLENPAALPINDPFYMLRASYVSLYSNPRRVNPIAVIAVTFKALNYAARNEKVSVLVWRGYGKAPEPFPELKV